MNMHNHAVISTAAYRPYGAFAAAAVCTSILLCAPFTLHAETAKDSTSVNPPAQQNSQEDNRSSNMRQGEMSPGLEKASELIGRDVQDTHGETIGEIKDLALNPAQQRVHYVVLSFGGVMGAGAELHAVPFTALDSRGDDDDLALNMTEQQLDNMQGFDDDNWPADVTTNRSDGNVGSAAASAGAVVKAKEYMDYEVKNLSGDDLGEVKDLAVDLNSGRILYAVIEHGGIATVGEKLIAVPTSKLSPGAEEDELVLNATDDELDRIKGFSDDSWPSATDESVSPQTGQVGISSYR